MQTQGISLVTSKMSDVAPAKSAKAKDSGFDSFMTKRADKAEPVHGDAASGSRNPIDAGQAKGKAVKLTKGQPPESAKVNLKAGRDGGDMAVEALPEEPMDVTSLREQVMALMQQILGLDEVQLQDILDQMDLSVSDILFPVQGEEGAQTMQEMLMQFVMEVHGIADKAAFLTNSDLADEWEQLSGQIAQVLAEAGETGEQMSQMPQGAQAEQAAVPELETEPEPEQMAKAAPQAAVPEKELVTADQETANAQEEAVPTEAQKGFTVTVETETGQGGDESQTGSQAAQQTALPEETEAPARPGETAAQLFAERLTEAFQESHAEGVQETEVSMSRIVEQVVNQVKIRVMPETTSMELQLHPAMLGRVHIQVSAAANGMSNAVLLVENQMAKEALESQMITLKQTFDEQGLKVDAVEVAVSDFGLNRDNSPAFQERQQNQPGGRRDRGRHSDVAVEDEFEDDRQTETARRDGNSVVDYTA